MKSPDRTTYILHILIIIATTGAAFGLGRLSVMEEEKLPLTISYFEEAPEDTQQAAAAGAPAPFDKEESRGGVVASKNGKAYHWPWCPGAQAISPENKIYFESKEVAEAAGYQPAKNCKGLE